MKKCKDCKYQVIHKFEDRDGLWIVEACKIHTFRLFCKGEKYEDEKQEKREPADKEG